MRTLKFRAYDSATGKVSEPFDVKERWGDYLIDFEDYSTDGALDSIIWEQFTGLLDRNGKEIYENDIIEYDWYIIGNKPVYRTKEQVVFDDMGARLDTDRIRFCTNVEVIGNIHENADLLGEDRNEKA